MSSTMWYDEVDLTLQARDVFARRELNNVIDVLGVRPYELYGCGVAYRELLRVRALLLARCEFELAVHPDNVTGLSASDFLSAKKWSRRGIRQACETFDTQCGRLSGGGAVKRASDVDWFDEVDLAKDTRDFLKLRGLYDPMDVIVRRPGRWYKEGISCLDLLHMREYMLRCYEDELRHHLHNQHFMEPHLFLQSMGWSEHGIRSMCRDIDAQERTLVCVSVVNDSGPAVDAMVGRASSRRHKHGESRKSFIRR